jgi:hypothetical protein
MPYEIIEESAKVYRVRFRHQDGEQDRYEYCEAAVRSWSRGGSLSIQSSYGNFAYSWNSTGDGPFLGFLLRLNFDYFMGKAWPGYMRFDHDKSIAEVRRFIIEQRRGQFASLTKEDARECWDHLETMEDTKDENYFLTQLLACAELSALYDGEYCNAIVRAPSPQAVGFWEELWPVLCAHWRAEIAAEQVAA